MEIEERLIEEIVQRITQVVRPDRIILFGSAASRTMDRDSDVDLLVLEPDVADSRAESQRLRECLAGLGVAVDVVVLTTQRFEETKGVIGGIAYPAAKYGRVIYEAA